MSTNWVPTKGPKTRRLAEERLHHLLFMHSMNSDMLFLETARQEIPEAWHTLEMDVETEAPKVKMTLYLDKAVAAMFRKMGKGYQARINRILETWMQMKMAEKAVFQKEIIDRLEEARADKEREDVGDKMLEHYAKLMEHWAYEEGWHDAKREMGVGTK